MAYKFSARSMRSLNGVHADLVRVAHRALELTPVDFVVIEGVRSVRRQRALVGAGASRTMNSRHITGHAIDVAAYVDGGIRLDWPLYACIAAAFKSAAEELEVPIKWGGDWISFRDGPHFELSRKEYP